MSTETLGIAHRWFDEIWNQRRVETVEELLTPESVCYGDDGPIRGANEFLERQYYPFTAAFPDLRVEVENSIAQGDQAVIRWLATGTHTGEGLGCAATHRTTTMQGITWLVIRDGKILEGWQSSNIADVVRVLAQADPCATQGDDR